jgi:predicted acylesterase/phospholipase RssA
MLGWWIVLLFGASISENSPLHKEFSFETIEAIFDKEAKEDNTTLEEQAIGVIIGISVILLFYFSMVGFLQYEFGISLEIPAVFFVTVWATILVLGLWLVVQFAERKKLPLFAIVILLVVLWSYTDLNDNHEIRHIRAEPSDQLMVPVEAAFSGWLIARANELSGEPYPVFLVAAEGGGIRAAYFTALVLEELRAACPRFLRQTFLITGVSGGSIGAALVAASAVAEAEERATSERALNSLPCGTKRSERAGATAEATRALSWDFLSPLLRGAMIPDLLARIIPSNLIVPDWVRQGFIYSTDRARYLERALDRAWRAETGRGLGDLAFQRAWRGPQGDLPALMLLTTNVETGRRMAVSHLTMPRTPTWDTRTADATIKATALDEAARLLTLSEAMPGLDVPLVTAAVLSSRFPLVTPAGTLPGAAPRRSYVDGGYFENSGLTTVLDVVDVLRQTDITDLLARGINLRLVILRIENSRASTNVLSAAGLPKRDPDSYFPEVASPLRALLATRHARGELARATVPRVIRDAEASCAAARQREPAKGCVQLEEIVFALEPSCVPIPLGWSLTQSARREMQRQLLGDPAGRPCPGESSTELGRNAQSLQRVLQLAGAGGGGTAGR